MSDGVTTDTGVVEAPASADPVAPEVPLETPSPASDPRPPETPVIEEPPVQAPQPAETPVIHVPQDPGEIVAATSHGAGVPPQNAIKSYLSAALEKIQFRKRATLGKIVQLVAQKKRIKNDDVEKLLHVSDSTAQRYLNQLVKEGKLKRVGALHQPTYETL